MKSAAFVAIGSLVALGMACSDNNASAPSSPPITDTRTTGASTTSLSARVDLPPIDDDILEIRSSLLNLAGPSFGSLQASLDAGTDWHGSITGIIIRDGALWYSCDFVLQSLPPQCGAGIALVGPDEALAEIEDDTSAKSLSGTFDAETISFVPDF